MKTLTLYQPWATLIALGEKRIETRSWYTSYRGPLAIHAGKTDDYINPAKIRYICNEQPFRKALDRAGLYRSFYLTAFPRGCIVATCELIACKKIYSTDCQPDFQGWKISGHYFPASNQEYEFGDYSIGRFMWFLANIKPLEKPIPAVGSQGLWDWSEPK